MALKDWKKIIDSKMETEFVNEKKNYKIKLIKFRLWEMKIYDNKGMYENQSLNRNSLSKTQALSYAKQYMRTH